ELRADLHAAEALDAVVYGGRGDSRGVAAGDRLGGGPRRARPRRRAALCDSFRLADSTFLGHCVDLSRRLSPGGLPDAAGGGSRWTPHGSAGGRAVFGADSAERRAVVVRTGGRLVFGRVGGAWRGVSGFCDPFRPTHGGDV